MKMIRTCNRCGGKLNIPLGLRITISCQSCGCHEGILSGEFHKKFECLVCGGMFSLQGNVTVPLYHDVPNCKSVLVVYIGDSNRKLQINSKEELHDNTLLFIRNRGLGDVLMTTAIVKQLKEENPELVLWYMCDPDIMPVLYNNPFIDLVLPLDKKRSPKIKSRIDLVEKLENYSENNGANKGNRLLRMFEISNVVQPNIIRPIYCVTDKEKIWAKHNFKSERKLVGIGLESFASFRTWSKQFFNSLVRLILIRTDWEIVLLGQVREKTFGSRIINTTGQLSIRELGAVVNRCDAIVCGDTGLYHLAEALSVPSVVMFGAIPPEARCSTYQYTHPLYEPSSAACVPCWDKQFGSETDLKKCYEKGPMCLKSIKPKTVLSTLKGILT